MNDYVYVISFCFSLLLNLYLVFHAFRRKEDHYEIAYYAYKGMYTALKKHHEFCMSRYRGVAK